MEPQWILLDCNEPFLGDVLCSIKDVSSYLLKKSTLSHFWPKYSVLLDNKCYTFYWFDMDKTLKKPCVAGKKLKENDLKRLKVLFNAVSVEFPPIISPHFRFVLSHQRFSDIYKYEKHVVKNNRSEGIFICSDDLMLIFKGANIFKCKNGTFISQQHLCDGLADCPGYQSLDEIGSQYYIDANRNYSGKCKFLTHPFSRKTICSDFYFPSENGTCTSYHFTPFENNFNKNKDAFIKCTDVRNNGLVMNCRQQNMDKINLIKMLQDEKYFQCEVHNQLPCLKGYSKCYNISDICTHKLDQNLDLSPCRNGGHLESFTEIDCNMMFKCPNYYWNYMACPNYIIYPGIMYMMENGTVQVVVMKIQYMIAILKENVPIYLSAERQIYVFTWDLFVMII